MSYNDIYDDQSTWIHIHHYKEPKFIYKSEKDFEELKLTTEGRIDWKKVTQLETEMVKELLPQKVEYHSPHSTTPITLNVYYGESTYESVPPAFTEREAKRRKAWKHIIRVNLSIF